MIHYSLFRGLIIKDICQLWRMSLYNNPPLKLTHTLLLGVFNGIKTGPGHLCCVLREVRKKFGQFLSCSPPLSSTRKSPRQNVRECLFAHRDTYPDTILVPNTNTRQYFSKTLVFTKLGLRLQSTTEIPHTRIVSQNKIKESVVWVHARVCMHTVKRTQHARLRDCTKLSRGNANIPYVNMHTQHACKTSTPRSNVAIVLRRKYHRKPDNNVHAKTHALIQVKSHTQNTY